MPIKNREDAVEVEDRIKSFFDAEPDKRASELRALFVEVLDFDPAIGQVSLAGGTGKAELPAAADRIAFMDGVHVLYISLSTERTDRVRKTEASAAAKLIADQLGDDLLLVFTNRVADQIHLILPTFEGTRPTLRRMIIERDLPRRTAVQQVSNIYWNIHDGASIRGALNDAFNVERVTDEFFKEYKQVFDVTMERVQGFGDDDDETERKKFFVQTLFNRLMFIYFLSRKGWLAFRGNKDYLKALWDDYRSTAGENKNFYIDRLRLLFFAGLNNYRSEDLTSESESRRLIGEPPFLNGGLFDMTDLDTRSNVIIPDECISDMLVKLFDRFNFTVMESSPFDIEVGVDPKMLGKVFEELVTGRHDSGSYYTPRPVVSFMCREALKSYLAGQTLDLSTEAIEKFVDEHDTRGITLAAAHSVGNALARITVVDPACGSGAYLLGMMQELVDLQTVLYNVGVDSKSLYELKLGIIQRNIYGVDIDEFAVNIAMLRLWLSLSIEYEGEKPEPLPNLDFKIVCGDSLLGPDPSPGNYGDLFRHQVRTVADRLADLKDKHMRESGPGKLALKGKVEAVENELREALSDSPRDSKAVDWRVQFAEVFNRGGFDVAIANPPYVNMVAMKDVDANYRALLKSTYSTARGGFDIFVPFMERGMQVLCPGALMAYITPNKLLAADYAKTLRSFMMVNTQLLSIIDCYETPIFNVSVYPVITVASKGRDIEFANPIKIYRGKGGNDHTQEIAFDYSTSSSMASQFGDLWSPFLAPDARELLPIIEHCDLLGDVAEVSASATVSEAYEWQEAISNQGTSLHLLEPDRYRPFIVSGNIRRYFHTWNQSPVQYIKHRYEKPVLDIYHNTIRERRRHQIRRAKVVVSGMSRRPTSVFDETGIAAGKSTVLVIAADFEYNAFMCGLLNSDIMRRIYLAMFGSLALAGGFLRFGAPQIRKLPVPKANETQRQEIAKLVWLCSNAEPAERDRCERETNRAVSVLFGL